MEETVVGVLNNKIKVQINKIVDKILDFSSIFDELKQGDSIAKYMAKIYPIISTYPIIPYNIFFFDLQFLAIIILDLAYTEVNFR